MDYINKKWRGFTIEAESGTRHDGQKGAFFTIKRISDGMVLEDSFTPDTIGQMVIAYCTSIIDDYLDKS